VVREAATSYNDGRAAEKEVEGVVARK